MIRMHMFDMKFPGGKKKAVTLSYDDGVIQDQHLIEIMRKTGLKGTFNISSGKFPLAQVKDSDPHRKLTKSEAKELYLPNRMEVSIHGLTHPNLAKLSLPECAYELIQDRKNLESYFDMIVRGMAYPYGAYNDDVIHCVKTAGIVYARTTISTKKFDLPENWLKLYPTCHHADPALKELMKDFVMENKPVKPMLFYLWGHSYEFDDNQNWNIIETFADYIGNRDDIWYATNIEIYSYIKAFKSLVYDVESNIVFNPSCFTVLFGDNGYVHSVGPGKYCHVR